MVFKSVRNLYVIGIIGSLCSLWNNMLMAQYFGTGPGIEAFFAAMALNGIMRKIAQSGYLMDIFLPNYFQVRKDSGREEAFRMISVLVNQFFLAGIVISGVFLAFAPYFIDLMVGGFDAGARAAAVHFFYWIAPLMPITVSMVVVRHMLNAEKLFAKIETVSVIGNLVSVTCILTFHNLLGVKVMVLNTFFIEALQFSNAAYYLRKLGYKHRFELRSPHIPMREILLKLSSTSGYLVSVLLLDFTLSNLLSSLPQGTYAVYRYGERVFQRANSLILTPVTTVLKVAINESVASAREASIALVGKAVHFGILSSLGVFFAFLICGTDAVQFLFRGRFPLVHVMETKKLLVVFFGTTAFIAVDIVYQTTAIALGRGKTHYILRIGQNIAGALMAMWFIHHWDFNGVLAYRIGVMAVAFGISIALVSFTEKEYLKPLFSLYSLRIAIAVAAGYLVLAPFAGYLQVLKGTGWFPHLANLSLQLSLYCCITYPVARALHIHEIATIEEKFLNVVKKMKGGKVSKRSLDLEGVKV